MNRKRIKTWHILFDYLAAASGWALFFTYRKLFIESVYFGYKIPVELNIQFFIGVLFLPLFWIILYHSAGHYVRIFRKSYAKVIGQTFFITLIGVSILFFLLILDDVMSSYKKYYLSFLVLFTAHYFITLLPRLFFSAFLKRAIRRGTLHFTTLIIGSSDEAVEIYKELKDSIEVTGNNMVGFVHIKKRTKYPLEQFLKHMGGHEEVGKLIYKHKIEEVIIAIGDAEKSELTGLINILEQYDVIINVLPSLYDILTGKVKITTLFNTPLVQVSTEVIPVWQENLKQFLDIIVSLFAILLLLPLSIILAIVIKTTSKGPVFYSHQRIGRFGKPFNIIKFRSMYQDAEKNGPELTKKNDNRMTPVGRYMRKFRLDEIPNFLNVIKGDMSLVGPRPERKYFIEQIVKESPHYRLLHKVKPGITSWGQVKYGYAENVEQMLKRLRYDLLYIQNRSIYIDLKILYYTILVIIKGRGV